MLRLAFVDFDLTNQYDTCQYWKAIDSIETKYGPDEAIDYTRGNALLLLHIKTKNVTGILEKAVFYFEKVIANGKNAYYVTNANWIREEIVHPSLEANLSALNGKSYAPAAKLRIPITYINVDTILCQCIYLHSKKIPQSESSF